MSFNRLGLIIIIAGFIFLVGTATQQMNQEQTSEKTEIEQLASAKLEQERLAAENAEKMVKDKLAAEKVAMEKLEKDRLATQKQLASEKGLMGKLEQDRQAAERWQAAAEMARKAKPDLQVQTMIDPKAMVLVTTAKKKSRITPKKAKTLVQKVRDQMGEGVSVKILDGTGKEISRSP